MSNNQDLSPVITEAKLLQFYNTYVKPYINAESGGHEIMNEGEVTALTQRETMVLNAPLFAEDDSTNEATNLNVDVDADLSSFPIPQGVEDSKRGNPVGTILAYFGDSAPDGYLACDGSAHNKTDYPTLAAHLATLSTASQYVVDGDNTKFKVPDLRGEFLRGTGTNSHTNQGSGSTVGTHQDATEIPYLGFTTNAIRSMRGNSTSVSNYDNLAGTKTANYLIASASVSTGSSDYDKFTVRPTNCSVFYCIKY